MQNVVPCKRCNTEFEYSPGFAGNAPQFCKPCVQIRGQEELEHEKELSILEGNKYLVSAPDYKSRYDVTEILVEGIMPDLPDEGEKFTCAMEVALFLRRQKGGFCGTEKNVAKFLQYIGSPHNVLVVKQWTLQMIESACKHPDLVSLTNRLYQIIK